MNDTVQLTRSGNIPPVTEIKLYKEEPAAKPTEPTEPVEAQSGDDGAKDPIHAENPETEAGAVEPPKDEPEEDKIDSARFAALSKREAEITRREQEHKEAIEHSKYIEENIERFKKSPRTVLEELNLDYETFTKMYLDELDGKEPESNVEDIIREVDEKNESRWRDFEEKQAVQTKAEQEKIVNDFKSKMEKSISSNEAYELINMKGAYDVVFDVIEKHFEDTSSDGSKGEILSVEAAADIVEKHFEEEAALLLKAKKLKKVGEVAPETKEETVTLSNKTSTQARPAPNKFSMPSQTEASKRLAASKLKWK